MLTAVLASCGLVEADGAINVYARNGSAADIGFQLDSALASSWSRLATGFSGCTAVSSSWTISIGAAGVDGEVGEYHRLLSAGDVAEPLSAEIWIDVADDGSVTWGEGRPVWDRSGPQDCGQLD